jgi:DNA polymerase-3 subunit beta
LFVEVSQKSLSTALQHVIKAVSAKSPIPILSGIFLQADSKGLTLIACNSAMMLQYEIPSYRDNLIIQKSGSIVAPARYFIDIIRNLPAGLVTLETKENLVICIRSGKVIYRLCGMDPVEYPQMASMDSPDLIDFPNHFLKKLISQVAFAVSSSESRPILTGVSCQYDGEQLKLLATDGIRLASRVTKVSNKLNRNISNVIIPGKNLFEFSKMLTDEQATTDIFIGDNRIVFKTQNLLMQSSLIEGTYPSLDKIAPEAYTTEIIMDSITFLHALERVSLLAGDDNVVKLIVSSSNTIDLVSRTLEIGDVMEEVQLEELHGDHLTVHFNGKYMIDILRSMDCNQVKLGFSGKWSPIIVQPTDSSTSLYIITPIRSNL